MTDGADGKRPRVAAEAEEQRSMENDWNEEKRQREISEVGDQRTLQTEL